MDSPCEDIKLLIKFFTSRKINPLDGIALMLDLSINLLAQDMDKLEIMTMFESGVDEYFKRVNEEAND